MPDADTVRRAHQRIGTLINGKYRIDRVLGIGGMGVVYAATHRNQKQFAVKMLRPELSFREDIRTRFLREGYASNSVKHPGAVAVMDDDVAEDGSAFLVMEMLEGAPVDELWEKQRRRLPLSYALAISHQLLDVLAAAHANGIVHRDVKPANLFLTFEGQVKVLDFGIARVRDLAASGLDGTGTGTLLGTPAFMSPEQALARSGDIDAQTDVWAVGATLFALLSGHLVHEGDTASELLVRAATTSARSLATVTPEMPAPVVAVVDRALAYRKNQRWPTAVAMRDAVRDANLATIGRVVARESLLPLFAPEELGLARTQHAAGIASTPFGVGRLGPSPPRPTSGHRPVVIAANPPLGLEGPAAPAGTLLAAESPHLASSMTRPVESFGGTTAEPISSTQAPSPAPGIPKKRVLSVVAASGFALAFVGVGVVAVVKLLPQPTVGATIAASRVTSSAASPALPTPSRDLLIRTPPLPGSSVSVATKTPLADAALGDPSATTNKKLPVSGVPPAPAPERTTAPIAPLAPTQSARHSHAPAADNCDPPYYFDAEGNRMFKNECL